MFCLLDGLIVGIACEFEDLVGGGIAVVYVGWLFV